VLPLDDAQVAVANLPEEELEGLVRQLKSEEVEPQAAAGSAQMKLDASAYVAWAQRRDRTVTGDTVGGPRFVALTESPPLEARLTARDGVVALELVLPGDLLENLGQRAQEMR
jgi:hypothetical protein